MNITYGITFKPADLPGAIAISDKLCLYRTDGIAALDAIDAFDTGAGVKVYRFAIGQPVAPEHQFIAYPAVLIGCRRSFESGHDLRYIGIEHGVRPLTDIHLTFGNCPGLCMEIIYREHH